MALLDDEELLPFFGNPNIQRQGARARALAAQRDVNTLPDPRTYAAVSGLLGQAPDEMGFSVLNPQYQSIMQTARPAFATGTALGVAPLAKVFQAPAMALGRAGERMAERVVPQIMERGGLPAELLQGMSRGTVSPLDVYHGTPHTLPPTARNPLGEFDASKIGTGEGAQSYGYGIYTAEARPVAEGYAKNVKDMASIKKMNEELSRLSKVMEADSQGGYRKFKSNVGEDAAKRYDELIANRNKVSTSVGNLYKADLPDEMIPKMLDYDSYMSEQSPAVQKILLPYQKEIGGSFGTGEQTLKAIAFERRMKGLDDSPAAVAKQLREMGIPGVKYLDERSRRPGITSMTQAQMDARINSLKKDIDSGLGDQKRMKEILAAYEAERASHANLTRNFVIFPGEEKNLRILERNGLLGD